MRLLHVFKSKKSWKKEKRKKKLQKILKIFDKMKFFREKINSELSLNKKETIINADEADFDYSPSHTISF